MKVELLVSEWCPTCPQAERVWRAVAAERDFEFAVLDMAQPEGRELAQRLRLKTIPAVVIDGTLTGLGVQSPAEAHRMVAAAPLRKRASPRHAGMLLSTDNRAFIVSAMVYLMLAGGWLLAHGALLTGDALHPVGLHLFSAGFVVQLIYGVGAHMLPRFTGNPIVMGAWPWLQWACLNAGVALLAAGFIAFSTMAAVAGGALMWVSLAIFTVRVWPVLWPSARTSGRAAIPLVPAE